MIQFHPVTEPMVAMRHVDLGFILELLQANGGFPIVLVNNDKSLFGVVSAGDIARFLRRSENISIEQLTADMVANQVPFVGHVSDSIETIDGYLVHKKIRSLPILDTSRRVVKIVSRQSPYLQIGKFRVGSDSSPFLLAEIGVNHNGDSEEALWLVRQAAAAGCHAVKFQHRSHELYNKEDINSFDLGTQYIIAEIERTRLSISIIEQCCSLARDQGMEAVITPFDEIALQEVMDSSAKPTALKIASCDLTNHPLIRSCASTGLPLILSTGMSYERDIQSTSNLLRSLMIEHAFLHCNSTYPAPPHDVNLAYMNRLRNITRTVVGYSSHDGNTIIPTGAIAFGASILEFHITRSRESEGTDHRASIAVAELPGFVRGCSLMHAASGQATPRTPSQGELANRQSLGKSYALTHPRPAGYRLTTNDLILVSPGSGFGIDDLGNLVGRTLKKDVSARRLLRSSDLEGSSGVVKAALAPTITSLMEKGYLSGVPVRYHDVLDMQAAFGVPMLEFHMSDRDLNLDPADFLHEPLSDVDLIVHAVEQYEDGFILDLASTDSVILQRSFDELQRLFDHVNHLRSYFKQADQIPVVLNVGGFTTDDFLPEKEYRRILDIATTSLQKLQSKYSEFRLLPQTMPPFPWHQGGRSFHNLLTTCTRVRDFIDATGLDICFDVSHTALSCAHFGESIVDHVGAMAGRIAHIHLSDAQGSNAEGLEIGEGSIDFSTLHQALQALQGKKQKIYMIPEIWQGHLQGGEKFARSLMRFNDRIS
jgi:sialic acid synthase SpsE/sugar phosphate isomerase/epimerase